MTRLLMLKTTFSDSVFVFKINCGIWGWKRVRQKKTFSGISWRNLYTDPRNLDVLYLAKDFSCRIIPLVNHIIRPQCRFWTFCIFYSRYNLTSICRHFLSPRLYKQSRKQTSVTSAIMFIMYPDSQPQSGGILSAI